MNANLQDRVVLVTGASGGIGSAIATQFAREGARVVAHYRRGRARADALRRELGQNCLTVAGDLTREADVRRVFAQAISKFGRIDTLVANAASWETRDVPMHEMTLRQWRATQDGVLTSAFLCLRESLRAVARQRQGNAVLIASSAAVFGEAGHADYAAGKHRGDQRVGLSGGLPTSTVEALQCRGGEHSART